MSEDSNDNSNNNLTPPPDEDIKLPEKYKDSKLFKELANANSNQLTRFGDILKGLTQLPKLSDITLPSYELSEIELDLSHIEQKNMEEAEIRQLQLEYYKRQLALNQIELPEYDPEACVVSFMGKDIQIPKDSKQSDLCRIILEDVVAMKKRWQWDEIAEQWERDFDESYSKKVYTAAKSVNDKVAIETTIKNFFIVNMSSVQLNPKFIQ